MNKLYTAQEIADKLKIKKTTVYELIKRGELESSKIGKQLRISEEQLNRYLQGGDASVSEVAFAFPDFQSGKLSSEKRLSSVFQRSYYQRTGISSSGISDQPDGYSSPWTSSASFTPKYL